MHMSAWAACEVGAGRNGMTFEPNTVHTPILKIILEILEQNFTGREEDREEQRPAGL